MSLRVFVKEDQSPSKPLTTLENHMNFSSFAAPKRTYLKPSYSNSKVPKKNLDENDCPQETRKETENSLIPKLVGTKVLEEINSDNKQNTLFTPRKLEISCKTPSSIKAKGQVERALKEFGLKWNSNEKLSGSNMKNMTQDPDNMVISLIEEIDRLNELLIEKINENEKLKVQNVSLETRLIEMSHKEANVGILRQELLRKTSNEVVSFDTQLGHKITLNSEESSETSFDSNLQRKCKTCNNGSKEKGIPSQNQLKESYLEKTQSHLSLLGKSRTHDFSRTMENLNEMLAIRENENYALRSEIENLRKSYESVSQQVVQHQQVAEKLRCELKNSHSQNHDLNQKLSTLKSEMSPKLPSTKGTTLSFTRLDSPKSNFSTQEITEWQRKYEATKKDNERLIKIVEQNQTTIKSFKDIFSDLQKRHNLNYEQLKKEYEGRMKGLTESRFESQNSFTNTSHSLISSNEFLRSSRDNLDFSRSKYDLYNLNKS